LIFDEATLRKLNRLTLVASRVRPGVMKGERRSTKRGATIEFADYRNYTPGDDIRRLDWNVYARLSRPFVRLFEEEEDLAVHILIDASASMEYGEGDQCKFDYALKLAAGLGAIALNRGDRLRVALLKSDRAEAVLGPVRGRPQVMQLLRSLDGRSPDGKTDLDSALRKEASASHRPGLCVLISDLFSPTGYEAGLGELQSRGHDVAIIQLLSPPEIEPDLAGDLRLIDVETGEAQDVTLEASLRRLYSGRVREWREGIQATCHRREVRFLAIVTDRAWDQVILHELRRSGIAR